MQQENALRILKSRKVITKAGKYQLKVTSDPNWYQPEEGDGYHIANVQAMNVQGASKAKAEFGAGNFDEACNKTGLSTRIYDGRYLPSKGELVNVVVDEVELRDGSKELRIISLTELPTQSASNFSLESDDSEELDIANEVAEETPQTA